MNTNEKSSHNGEETYALIQSNILKAKESICIAAAWFTDKDLFAAVDQNLSENSNLDVSIILDNNKDNYYLPFNSLVEKGAKIKVIGTQSERGQMHAKFAIFDSTSLITGSYNWSKNARVNNEESVIYTQNPKLIQEHQEKFNQLFENGIDYQSNGLHELNEAGGKSANTNKEVDTPTTEYEKVLNELVYAQVHNYDSEGLQTHGYARSKSCEGNAVNLSHELDSVYTSFLRDIKLADEKKEQIVSSINLQLEKTVGQIESENRNDCDLAEKEFAIKTNSIDNEISEVSKEVELLESEIKNVKEVSIPHIKEKITHSESEIEDIQRQNFRPKIAWYSFVPNLVFLLLVTLYCIVFYSSAAYILIYSGNDAQAAKMANVMIESPEVFDGAAFEKAMSKGFVPVFFILLVPIFVMGLIYIANTWSNKIVKYAFLSFVILFFDGFTAYKVAESIHSISYLSGGTNEVWQASMIFSNSDFYMVFVFGFLGLLSFEFLLGNILITLNDRNRDLVYLKSQNEIKILKNKILRDQETVVSRETKLNENGAILNNLNAKIEEKGKERLSDKLVYERRLSYLKNDFSQEKKNVENITEIHKAKIENEIFSFSPVFIQDRISVFLSGWKDYLHKYFANQIAVSKSREADAVVANWRTEKLKNYNTTK